jgi:hypothetical protein
MPSKSNDFSRGFRSLGLILAPFVVVPEIPAQLIDEEGIESVNRP